MQKSIETFNIPPSLIFNLKLEDDKIYRVSGFFYFGLNRIVIVIFPKVLYTYLPLLNNLFPLYVFVRPFYLALLNFSVIVDS